MSQAMIARVLSIEREATRVRDQAVAQAAQVAVDFEKEASAARDKVLREARAQAARIEEEGQAAAEAERAKVLEQAEVDAQRMERLAAQNFDKAVKFILDQVTGRS